MSRSSKKAMGGGICGARSEAWDKQTWHQAYRRRNKIIADGIVDGDEVEFVDKKQVSNPWSMAKDGKTLYWTEGDVRTLIRAEMAEIRDGRQSITRHWYVSNMMKHFRLKTPEELLGLSDSQVEEYVQVFIKKAKAK